ETHPPSRYSTAILVWLCLVHNRRVRARHCVPKRTELDLFLCDCRADAWIAQGLELALALADVDGVEAAPVPGMAAQLRGSVGKPADERDQGGGGDPLRVRGAVLVLAVEAPEVPDRAVVVAHGHAELGAERDDDRAD